MEEAKLAMPGPEQDPAYHQLDRGDVLLPQPGTMRPSAKSYVVIGRQGRSTEYGQTYFARSVTYPGTRGGKQQGSQVVIKIPSIPTGLSPEALNARIDVHNAQITALAAKAGQLQQARGFVAQILGLTYFDVKFAGHTYKRVLCLVQEFVEGIDLEAHLARHHASADGRGFHGIDTEEAFFRIAHKICTCVLHLHQAGIIHGDIWQKNIIMVGTRKGNPGRPVLIDIGQFITRDFPRASPEGHHQLALASNYQSYLAPERRQPAASDWYMAADIFSLGGTLGYLATGAPPPNALGENSSRDATKNIVVGWLARNAKLHLRNPCIADMIARCMRYPVEERTAHVQNVLHDLELASAGLLKERRNPIDVLLKEVEAIKRSVTAVRKPAALFHSMMRSQLRGVVSGFQDIRSGSFDVTRAGRLGGGGGINTVLSHYLSMLGRGDQYFTLSVPEFWSDDNLGINGRFLAMNHLVARRGATVIRLFVIGPRDEHGDWNKIAKAHRDVALALGDAGISVNKPTVEEIRAKAWSGFYTGVIAGKSGMDKTALKRSGDHCGVWRKGEEAAVITPVYNEQGRVIALRFRESRQRGGELVDEILNWLARSQPLIEYAKRFDSNEPRDE